MHYLIITFIFLTFSLPDINGQVSTRYVRKMIKDGNLSAIKELIASGQDVNKRFKGQSTLLHIAVEYGKLTITKYLISIGANLDIQDKHKDTPLLISTSPFYRNDSIAEYLIYKGANLNAVGLYGSTALRNSIGIQGYGRNIRIFKLLVEKGADINYHCDECCNRSIFLYASAWGSKEMVQILLDKAININQTDCKGLNGLMYAIKSDNLKVIELLLINGINKNHKDNRQMSVYDYAEKTKNKEIIEIVSKHK